MVPLLTIGNFRNIFHSNEKKEAIDALKDAQQELEVLRDEISKLLNQTSPDLSKQDSLTHKRVVREIKEPTLLTNETLSSPTTSTTTISAASTTSTKAPVDTMSTKSSTTSMNTSTMTETVSTTSTTTTAVTTKKETALTTSTTTTIGTTMEGTTTSTSTTTDTTPTKSTSAIPTTVVTTTSTTTKFTDSTADTTTTQENSTMITEAKASTQMTKPAAQKDVNAKEVEETTLLSILTTTSDDGRKTSTVSVQISTTATYFTDDGVSVPRRPTSESESFNTVFDIFDKMSTSEKLFTAGDYSAANKYEDLVRQLQVNVGIIVRNYRGQTTDETSHLMSYLLKMIDYEDAKLKNLIKRLEESDVTMNN